MMNSILKKLQRFNLLHHPKLFRFILNSWPPYIGAAVRVEEIAADWQQIRVKMGLRWYNQNYMRTHFGGNLYTMTDPFFVLMLMAKLGGGYEVWDSAARIKFLKPGRSRVFAHFVLDSDRLEKIRKAAATGEKLLEKFRVDIVDPGGEPVARVYKRLYICKKR